MRDRSRWLPVMLLLAVLLSPFIVPIPDDLARRRSVLQVGQLAHVFLPLILTLALYRFGPLRGRIWASAFVALFLAAICELPQGLVGRSARLRDVGFDLAGAIAAAAWLRLRNGGSRRWLLLLLAALALVPWHLRTLPGRVIGGMLAAERFPLIADFETEREMRLWALNENGDGTMRRIAAPGAGNVLELGGEPGDYYPGAVLRGAPRDWSGYRLLVFDVRVAAGDSAVICARLDDFKGRRDTSWCGGFWRIGPEWKRCELDLPAAAAEVAEREFRLDDIDSMVLYLTGMEGPTIALVDNLQLLRGGN